MANRPGQTARAPRVLLMGLTGFGNAALRALAAESVPVAGIFTRAESAPFPYYAERSISEEAREFGIPVYEDVTFKETATHSLVRDLAPDLILCATYHHIVPRRVIQIAPLGGVNLHPSLLPKLRGPNPTNWAIIFGEEKVGVTLHVLTNQLDAGDILLQRECPVSIEDTDGRLRQKLAALTEVVIREYLQVMKRGESIIPKPQHGGEVTYFPRVMERDGLIQFNEPTAQIYSRIRGTTPYPGAFTWLGDRKIRILGSEMLNQDSYEVAPGLITRQQGERLDVKTKDGMIQIRVAPGDAAGLLGESPLILGPSREKSVAFAVRGDSLIVHTREKYGIEQGAEEFPKMVVLSVAYPCNALCPNCPYTETNSDIRKKYADRPYILSDLFHKIAEECGQYGSYLRITGGGEPMMHPDDMSQLIARAKGVNSRVWLNTNGSLFTEENMRRLLACGTDMIECSVDAADPDIYKIVRAGLDWDRLVASVRRLLEIRQEIGSPTRIVVSVINQAIVRDKMDGIANFWLKDIGVDEVIRRKFLTWGSNTTLDPSQSADPSAYLDKFEGEPCPYPFHRLNIDSRGKVEVCGYDISGRTNFGDISERSIREIWLGPMFDWWRRMHAEGRGGEIPLCRECPDWQYRSWNHNWEKVLRNSAKHRDMAPLRMVGETVRSAGGLEYPDSLLREQRADAPASSRLSD